MHNDLTFDSLGVPLSQTTFVVVDLETNGGSAQDAGITEIGAVKVRGGEVLGEFQTLINPGTGIPPFIALLTGITEAMIGPAPKLAEVLPSFWEWAGDAVLVAHNAPFDIGFLRAASNKLDIPWHSPRVLDTVTLAKAALIRDEVPNRKLSTLAAYFHSPTEPVHRALADACATSHVLHCLFERFGSMGITTIEETLALTTVIKPAQRKKRHLAEHLPNTPGVYIFQDDRQRALYIGKSRNLRKRAMSYFTRSETRDRISRMIDLASSIAGITCYTELEASVRELRLIRETKPPFNQASKRTERTIWIRLTREPYPRLSAVREVRPDLGVLHLGPVKSMEQASLVIDAITTALGLRTCTPKLSIKKPTSSCALADMGRCSAPCELRISVEDYGQLVSRLTDCTVGDSAIEDDLRQRIEALALDERYEEAAIMRDRLAAWLGCVARSQRLSALTRISQLVACAPAEAGWDIHVIRYGALAGAAFAQSTSDVLDVAAATKATAQNFETPPFPASALSVSEANLVLSWLSGEGVRLLECSEPWASPLPSQQSLRDEIDALDSARNNSAQVVAVKKFAAFTAPR